jgi:hypothetical protein
MKYGYKDSKIFFKMSDNNLEEHYPGYSFIEDSRDVEITNYFINENTLTLIPPAPSKYHVYKEATAEWVFSEELFSKLKTEKKQYLSNKRDQEELAGFFAFNKQFDSDEKSIRRINLAVAAADTFGETFSIDWTCSDNSVITLSYEMIKSLPMIMAQYGNTLHVYCRLLKDQVDIATTPEELDAITWITPTQ